MFGGELGGHVPVVHLGRADLGTLVSAICSLLSTVLSHPAVPNPAVHHRYDFLLPLMWYVIRN